MTITIQVRAEPELVRVVATGEFSLADAQRQFLEVLDAVARTRAKKILVDGRQLEGSPEAIERFLYGEFSADAVKKYIAERSVPPVPQFAYVLHEPVLDPNRFGETVAVNRGMWVKVFDNIEDAVRWLGVVGANNLDPA